jgi:hypothetical protein
MSITNSSMHYKAMVLTVYIGVEIDPTQCCGHTLLILIYTCEVKVAYLMLTISNGPT